MDVTRHWLAVRRDGSWDVIDSPAVAERRTRERGQVAGPFVPESQLQGAVGRVAELEKALDLAAGDLRSEGHYEASQRAYAPLEDER